MSKTRLLKNIASLSVIQVANYLFPMISIPIISRIIGPENFGIISLATAFVAYFTLLISFGFEMTALRKLVVDPFNKELRNRVFSEVFTSQCLLLAVSVVIFFILLFATPAFHHEKNVAIFTFITCIATVMTQNWLFQAMQDLPKAAILTLISKVIFTVLVLTMVREKNDYAWQPLALSISQIAMAVVSFVWAIKRYELKLYRVSIKDCLILLWNEKIFFLSLCMINLYTSANVIILGLVRDPLNVGYYTAGQKLIIIIQMIITVPLAQAFFPYIGRAFGESFNKGITIAQKLIPLVFAVTFILGILIFVGAPLFIHLFYGKSYLPAIEVCRILAFVPMIISLGTIMGTHVMLNLKMDKDFFRILCIGGGVSLLLNFLLVKTSGYVGAAYAWAIIEMLNLFLMYYYLNRKGIKMINGAYFKVSFYRKFIANPAWNKHLS